MCVVGCACKTCFHRLSHMLCYNLLADIHTCTYRYGDFHPVKNKERIFAIAIMLSTYIAYGMILGRSAAILAGFNFRRQTFKQRFAIIRKYLVRLCDVCG